MQDSGCLKVGQGRRGVSRVLSGRLRDGSQRCRGRQEELLCCPKTYCVRLQASGDILGDLNNNAGVVKEGSEDNGLKVVPACAGRMRQSIADS